MVAKIKICKISQYCLRWLALGKSYSLLSVFTSSNQNGHILEMKGPTMANNQQDLLTPDKRQQALTAWLKSVLLGINFTVKKHCGDASFRRYFRVITPSQQYIAMDAPPLKESCLSFVAISKALRHHNVCTPNVFEQNIDQGFLLLSDFGDEILLDQLNDQTVDGYYQKGIESLLLMQGCRDVPGYVLPTFDKGVNSYQGEMDLFTDWYLAQHRQLILTDLEQKEIQAALLLLQENNDTQPQVFVHRDYHSRNLMVLPEGSPLGVLDFQDAVMGPITYDLMSLLRDCYIDWPPEKVQQWALSYQAQANKAGILNLQDQALFLKWFDWTSLQRHLKCLGIFSRLQRRDNKPEYLQYLPRVLTYAQSIASRYKEFSYLDELFQRLIL